jgi:hypothetical protein
MARDRYLIITIQVIAESRREWLMHKFEYAAHSAGRVGNGLSNIIGSTAPANPTADYSFIGGGSNNHIDATGAATTYGVIGGGQNNMVAAGTNHSSIFGGNGNSVSGSCSAIFGGTGNSDGGFANIGIFGSGLTATVDPATYGVPSALWTDSLVMSNIPVDTTGFGVFLSLPQGALYTNTPLGSGYLSSQVYIK